MFWFFGHKVYGNLSSPTRNQTHTHALEGRVLTTGPPGRSQQGSLKTSTGLEMELRGSSVEEGSNETPGPLFLSLLPLM